VEAIIPGHGKQSARLVDIEGFDGLGVQRRRLDQPSYVPDEDVVADGLLESHPKHGVDVFDGRR